MSAISAFRSPQPQKATLKKGLDWRNRLDSSTQGRVDAFFRSFHNQSLVPVTTTLYQRVYRQENRTKQT